MRFRLGRWPISGGTLSQDVASLNRDGAEALTASGTQASGCFIGGARKERRRFPAEHGPDPVGHTRALEGPFSDLRIRAPFTKSS